MSAARLVYALVGGAGYGVFVVGLWAVRPRRRPPPPAIKVVVRPHGGADSGPDAAGDRPVDDVTVDEEAATAAEAARQARVAPS